MKHPDLKKYADEVNAMQDLPPATVKLPPLAALAIICHIQLATRHPAIGGDFFTKIAIDTAKQLQQLFDPESATYQVLERGWNPEEDFLAPSDEPCEEPCEEFLQNLGCRCTGYKVAEVAVGDEKIPPEILAAGAAMMQQLAQNLRSEGFEVVTDM